VASDASTVALAPPASTEVDLRQSRRRVGVAAIRVALASAAFVSVVTTVGIVLSLLLPAIEFFGEISPVEFFTGTDWSPLFVPASFGVLPLVLATFLVTFWALLVAVPAGIGTATYLSEYASPRARNILKPILEILAAIPTVVYGYFALTAVTPLLRSGGIQVEIFNVLAGGLVLGVMLIPTIASLSEDAMSAVPQALRDGSYGLGADRLQTSTRVVLPAAISGIIAAIVLGISRAVGETMIVLIAVGQLPQITFDPRETVSTLTAFIGATGNGDLPTGSTEYKTIFAVGLTLFVLTFIMNIISIRLVRKYREAYE
jgi:phosphate transport system permease protein